MSSPSNREPRVAHAYAKLNLGLRVLRKRPDGYHEIDTILQTVDLADRLTFWRAQETLEVECDHQSIPSGPQNLVWKALDTLRRHARRHTLGMRVSLEKGIPHGAGLGGGSSDAACALAVGSDIWGLGLHPAELAEIAARIGSDVPFFLQGGTCRARGRGERIEPLPPLEGTAFGLVVPPLLVPTQRVYMRINLTLTRNSLNASIVQQLKSPGVGKELADSFENDLEAAALSLFPELRKIRDGLRTLGLPVVRMTGSGGAFYFWPGETGWLREVETHFRGTGCRVQLVKATATGFTEGDP